MILVSNPQNAYENQGSELDSGATVWAVVLAGGIGNRVGETYPKQFHRLSSGLTVLDLPLITYQGLKEIDGIVIVYHKDYEEETRSIASAYSKVQGLILGGILRQQSVYNAITKLTSKYILIQDSARPIVSDEAIKQSIANLRDGNLCTIAACPLPPTAMIMENGKMVGCGGKIGHEITEMFSLGQCPVGFLRDKFIEAYELSGALRGEIFTDDCSIMLASGLVTQIATVLGHPHGFKLTHVEDFDQLEGCLLAKARTKKRREQ